MRRYFYARVSTKKQNLARQLEAARKHYDIADEFIFADKQSGKNMNREEYLRMKGLLEPGDEVVILSLDRLSRNKEDMKAELAWYREHGIVVRVLNIPTTLIDFGEGQEWVRDMINNIIVEVLGAVAQQELEMNHERQSEGIDAMPVDDEGYKISSKTGRRFGREPKNVDLTLMAGETVKDACKRLGISRNTYYRKINENSCRA